MGHNYSVCLFQLYIQGLGNDQDVRAIGLSVSQTLFLCNADPTSISVVEILGYSPSSILNG